MNKREELPAIDLSTGIYDFIDSPACAEYCRKTGHVFEPLDMADIILRSKKPMARRHEALRTLISDADTRMKLARECCAGAYGVYYLPYYNFIKKYIEYEQALADRFRLTQKGWIYFYCRDAFSTFSKALSYALHDDWMKDEKTFSISKQRLNFPDALISARVGRDGTVVAVKPEDEGKDALGSVRWSRDDIPAERARIPTPFKRGDIIRGTDCYSYDFAVVDDAAPGSESVYRVQPDRYGWHMAHEGLHPAALFDYDYFSGELSGEDRMLSYLSDMLTGKIRIDEYEAAAGEILKNRHSGPFIPDGIEV